MEILYIIIAVLLAIVGLSGAVLPVLPGPPIAFVALLMLLLCDGNDVSTMQLVVSGVLAVVITVVDYIAPVWLAKKNGGSKGGTWGATIGLLLGLFLGPIGIILGPFLGAYVGELIVKTPKEKAFEVAAMTFVAFMLTTGIKLVYGIAVLWMVCKEAWEILLK